MSECFLSKKSIRKNKKSERDRITLLGLREKYSHCIMEKIAQKIIEKNWKKIMLYYPIKNEVNCFQLFSSLQKKSKTLQEFQFFLPRIENEKEMNARIIHINKNGEIDENQLEKDPKLGVLQPKKNATSSQKIEIVVTPALAFDRNGNRVGYGKGFYDYFLANVTTAKSIGALYACQETEKIIIEKTDIPFDAISTENEWIDFSLDDEHTG